MHVFSPFTIEELEQRRLLSFSVTPFTPGLTTVLSTALLAPSSNISLTGSPSFVGGAGQAGTFSGFNLTSGSNTLAIPAGVLLTSGLASSAQGSTGGSFAWNTAGDTDLTTLLGGTDTHDANLLTLTFTTAPGIHSISFDFIFGSNEDPGSTFSDVFGAFLDGTQISFDNSLPITVGNNIVTYDNSGSPLSGKTNVTLGVGYDWLTGELDTTAPINTGITTHTLKLAIADAGDTVVDSGIFLSELQAGTAIVSGPTTGPTAVPGTFQVDQATGTVANTSSSINLTVDRDTGSSGSTTVDYATSNGTAAAGTDYITKSGTLTFADGVISEIVPVTILDNPAAAASSTFTLTLSNATGGASLGATLADVVTIQNTQSQVQFAAATYSFANTAGSVSLTVSRAGNTSSSATVHYSMSDGTAINGTDYTAASGVLSFSAAQSSATIAAALLPNAAGPANSTFTVTLSAAGGNGVLGALTSTVVTVQNNASSLGLAASTYSFANNSGSGLLTVSRTGNLSSAASVNYATTNGTAIAGVDYTATSGLLSFTSGQSSKTISVTLLANPAGAASSAFSLTLSGPTGNGVLGAQATATVTILANQSTAGFSSTTFSAAENVGAVVIELTRAGNTQLSGSVDYSTANGSAIAGTNYTATSGTLEFAPGQTVASFQVAVLQDFKVDPTLTVQLTLTNPQDGITAIGQGTAVLSITDVTPSPTAAAVTLVTPTIARPSDIYKPVSALTVSFDQALAASPALADFSLFRKFPDGKAGLGRLRKLVLVSATYDSTTHAVTVTPRAKLPRNRFYQLVVTGEPAHSINSAPVVGSANGATAATFTYSFARGRLLRYVDQDGNHVRLQLNGPGMMVLIRNANGEGETLTLTGTTSASRLVGKVRITHLGGDGTTTLTSITGLGLARNKLTAGAFTIAGGIS